MAESSNWKLAVEREETVVVVVMLSAAEAIIVSYN